jgi:hypothetical protein
MAFLKRELTCGGLKYLQEKEDEHRQKVRPRSLSDERLLLESIKAHLQPSPSLNPRWQTYLDGKQNYPRVSAQTVLDSWDLTKSAGVPYVFEKGRTKKKFHVKDVLRYEDDPEELSKVYVVFADRTQNPAKMQEEEGEYTIKIGDKLFFVPKNRIVWNMPFVYLLNYGRYFYNEAEQGKADEELDLVGPDDTFIRHKCRMNKHSVGCVFSGDSSHFDQSPPAKAKQLYVLQVTGWEDGGDRVDDYKYKLSEFSSLTPFLDIESGKIKRKQIGVSSGDNDTNKFDGEYTNEATLDSWTQHGVSVLWRYARGDDHNNGLDKDIEKCKMIFPDYSKTIHKGWNLTCHATKQWWHPYVAELGQKLFDPDWSGYLVPAHRVLMSWFYRESESSSLKWTMEFELVRSLQIGDQLEHHPDGEKIIKYWFTRVDRKALDLLSSDRFVNKLEKAENIYAKERARRGQSAKPLVETWIVKLITSLNWKKNFL